MIGWGKVGEGSTVSLIHTAHPTPINPSHIHTHPTPTKPINPHAPPTHIVPLSHRYTHTHTPTPPYHKLTKPIQVPAQFPMVLHFVPDIPAWSTGELISAMLSDAGACLCVSVFVLFVYMDWHRRRPPNHPPTHTKLRPTKPKFHPSPPTIKPNHRTTPSKKQKQGCRSSGGSAARRWA